jgi:hypothetical protein
VGRQILLLLGVFIVLPAYAKVFTFKDLDCRCEVPDSWSFRYDWPVINARDPTKQKVFELITSKVDPFLTLDNSKFEEGFAQAFLTRGFQVDGQEKTSFGGVDFLEIKFSRDLGTRNEDLIAYVTLANGYSYCLQTMEYNKEPSGDAEFQRILSSFGFLHPPVLPPSSVTAALARILDPSGTHPSSFLMGSYVGLGLVLAIVILLPIGIVLVVGAGIYLIVRQTKRRV